jgi:hypothetical protein
MVHVLFLCSGYGVSLTGNESQKDITKVILLEISGSKDKKFCKVFYLAANFDTK